MQVCVADAAPVGVFEFEACACGEGERIYAVPLEESSIADDAFVSPVADAGSPPDEAAVVDPVAAGREWEEGSWNGGEVPLVAADGTDVVWLGRVIVEAGALHEIIVDVAE